MHKHFPSMTSSFMFNFPVKTQYLRHRWVMWENIKSNKTGVLIIFGSVWIMTLVVVLMVIAGFLTGLRHASDLTIWYIWSHNTKQRRNGSMRVMGGRLTCSNSAAIQSYWVDRAHVANFIYNGPHNSNWFPHIYMCVCVCARACVCMCMCMLNYFMPSKKTRRWVMFVLSRCLLIWCLFH